MTDLELMYLLEEEGYEPDLENLLILKEGLETGEIEILDEANAAVKNYKKTNKWGTSYHQQDSVTCHQEGKKNTEESRDYAYGLKRMSIAHDKDFYNPNAYNIPDTGAHKGNENRRTARKDLKKFDEDFEKRFKR